MTHIARGLTGVVVAATRLSEVDGEAGSLVIAGYPVEQIAPRAAFEEVLFLLWHDRLPSDAELDALRTSMATRRALPAATVDLLRAAARARVGAMDALRMAVGTLSLLVDELGDGAAPLLDQVQAIVARIPTIVAAWARLRAGGEPVAPDPALGHAANYLYMLTGTAPDAETARALETYLNTVVDHGMNASTFTARVVVSTRSDLVSAIVAAVGALKGPLHGGAPGPALDMVFEIRECSAVTRVPLRDAAVAWTHEVVARGERVMGFGHRIYRVRDPRADVLAAASRRLFERSADPALYDDARECESGILEVLRAHRPERRLDTNVEFYTALILHGVGLSSDLFTPTFAVGRAGGWTAHCLEQIAEDTLIRPQSVYSGARLDEWLPAEGRA
jgi:citrate synthase